MDTHIDTSTEDPYKYMDEEVKYMTNLIFDESINHALEFIKKHHDDKYKEDIIRQAFYMGIAQAIKTLMIASLEELTEEEITEIQNQSTEETSTS